MTGGAGFIGSAVVRQAISDDEAVVNVDALTYTARLDSGPWWRASHDRNGVGKRLGAG